MKSWTQQRQVSKTRDSGSVVVAKCRVLTETAEEIRKVGPIYGSQGRALQVAAEVLIRMERPPEVEPFCRMKAPDFVRISMRLHKRTLALILKMAVLEYNDDPGQVLSACVKVLKMKTLKP